jgi:hypothetical protein
VFPDGLRRPRDLNGIGIPLLCSLCPIVSSLWRCYESNDILAVRTGNEAPQLPSGSRVVHVPTACFNKILHPVSQALTTLKKPAFSDVTPCGSCKNRSFGGKYRLCHQDDKNRRAATSNRRTLRTLRSVRRLLVTATFLVHRFLSP